MARGTGGTRVHALCCGSGSRRGRAGVGVRLRVRLRGLGLAVRVGGTFAFGRRPGCRGTTLEGAAARTTRILRAPLGVPGCGHVRRAARATSEALAKAWRFSSGALGCAGVRPRQRRAARATGEEARHGSWCSRCAAQVRVGVALGLGLGLGARVRFSDAEGRHTVARRRVDGGLTACGSSERGSVCCTLSGA
eukprot:scaffold135507_cov316-Phaeocystis_antarctica.AAC.2